MELFNSSEFRDKIRKKLDIVLDSNGDFSTNFRKRNI